MTPLGHMAIGYLASRRLPGVGLWPVIVGSCLPDVDFLFILWDGFNQLHRRATHSLLFVGCAALIFALALGSGRLTLRKGVFWGVAAGGILHLMVDACLDSNPTNGLGVAFLWPFYPEPIALLNLLEPAAGTSGWADPSAMVAAVLRGMIWEVVPAAFALWLALRCREASGRQGFAGGVRTGGPPAIAPGTRKLTPRR